MFDTNAISALVHHRAGWERFTRRISILVGNMREFARVPARRFMECPLSAMQPRRSVAQWRLCRIESRYW